jgi:hypothetical protein
MADQYLLLLNDALKRHILGLGAAEKRRLQEKLEFLANGIWDAGVRVKKLKGAGRKMVFEARLSRSDRILFTLGRHRDRVAAYVWGLAAHDEVARRALSIIPENAPFLDFEPETVEELPEMVLESPASDWLTQENIEEKAGEGFGPQKWLVLNDEEWKRLLAGAEPDSLEIYLFLTREQEAILQREPPVLLSGTAGSGKTTILVYYLLRPEFRAGRRLFLTYSPFLQRFSERIYRGLVKNTDLDPANLPPERRCAPWVPDFRVFRELVESILAAHGITFDREAEVRLPEFERIFRNHQLYRRYDPELVWEEIRSIIKGAKPPIDAPSLRRLSKDYLQGALGQAGLRRLQEYLLGLKAFEWIVKIERILERRTDYSSYDRFVQGLADPEPSARGQAQFLLEEILRLVEDKARGFGSPLLTFTEYSLLGRKKAPNFLYDRQEIYSIAEYYQERLQAEGRWDEIDLCRQALSVLDIEEERFAYDLVLCDEVQDFADIQLSLVFRLARPFHRIAVAGDLKQVINPSGFRWEDVKQKFYERGREPPEVQQLSLNFRCVGSIVRLANTLLEIKQALVGLSGTEIREDWKFQGKPPFLVTEIEEEEVLRRAKITGAGRIILVRDIGEQRRLKALLASELIFTLHEAKGLEFDAVLLWKFAQDGKAGEIWRRILRGQPAEPAHAPHARHELNLLYVAVTRARNVLIIYDGPRASPIWEADKLRELIHRTNEKEVLSGLWERVSTPDQWQEQGDYFFDREHYAAAAECYRNAGDQAKQEIAEAFAWRVRGEAERGAELFARHGYSREAAEGFEKARHFAEAREQWLRAGEPKRARVCELKSFEAEGRYEEAAAGWQQLGEPAEAARDWEKARNFAKLADYLFARKDFLKAAERYQEAGDLARAAESLRRAKLWNKAADLYWRSGAWSEAALLYKKSKNQDRLLDCYEKLGDYYAAAIEYEKRKELDKCIAAFRRFAEQEGKNRELLLQQAQSFQRAALKAAVRYSALSLHEKSAPLYQARGMMDRARAAYLASGNPLAAAECLAAMGMHLKAAREMEALEFPGKEERIQAELFDHVRAGVSYDLAKAQELAREGEQLLARGEGRKALRRFRVLGDTDGMLRTLLSLKDDAEALHLLLEEGEREHAQRYIETRGRELEVPLTVLEGLVSRYERGGYIPNEETRILIRLFSQSLSRQKEATLPLLRRLFSLHQPYFSFDEEDFNELFSLLLEAKNYNAIYETLLWHRVEKSPQFLPPLLNKLENAVKKSGDANLLACIHYFRNQSAFDALVPHLSVGQFNYKLVGASERHYQRAVRWLLDKAPPSQEDLEQAASICRIHRNFGLAAEIYEQHGLLAEAGRNYRQAGLFEQALACYRQLEDEPNQARIYEKLGAWDKALEIWQRRGRTRDVQRVQKRKAQVEERAADEGEGYRSAPEPDR